MCSKLQLSNIYGAVIQLLLYKLQSNDIILHLESVDAGSENIWHISWCWVGMTNTEWGFFLQNIFISPSCCCQRLVNKTIKFEL